jgi:predicted ATPase
MGIHTGTPFLGEEGYVGVDVHRAARIAACGHGGLVLVSGATAALADVGELRDLGEHRLKDLSAPERIYQLGDGEFPPLKSLYRTNLPVPATPFLGRERELVEVIGLLESTRLLTLTGPGGTGKTRLALQAAGSASEAYPDGVFWVPLAPLRDPALVLATAGQTLGSKNGLAEHIRDRAILILFDNFEQVVDAAPDLAELVSSCPNLDVLVTSRERLRIGGEQTYPVPPLAESDGQALFLSRARAVDPGFTPSDAVRELCLRLDELPLALELAAARTALFSPEQLLEKLSERLDLLKGERDADPRQQTLRETIEWSYDLLAEDEQRLFSRLAVFAGGCNYEAAEEVAAADPDTLQSLLDKSLLRKRDSGADPRYWMLETIHDFAVDKLEAADEGEDMRRRHADHFLGLVDSAPRADSTALSSNVADTTAWRSAIQADFDNVRGALEWFRSNGMADKELQIAFVVAWLYVHVRGSSVEVADWLESLVARADQLEPAQRVDAMHSLAHFGTHLSWERRRELAQASVDLARAIADRSREEWALRRLANVWGERDLDEARGLLLECERLARELPEQARFAWIQQNLGFFASLHGDLEEARARLRESVSLFERSGAEWQAVNALDGLGVTLVKLGEADAARETLANCLRRANAIGALSNVESCLTWAARLGLDDGKPEVATRLLAAAAAIRDREGYAVEELEDALRDLTATQRKLRDRLETRFETLWEVGRSATVDEAVKLALTEIAGVTATGVARASAD